MRSVRRMINPTPASLRPLVFIAMLALTVPSVRAEDDQSAAISHTPPARVPASVAREISLADEVVITEEGERTIHEYWMNGEMRVIRVIPAVGPEYYLYPEDQTLESGIDQSDPLLVRWKILEF